MNATRSDRSVDSLRTRRLSRRRVLRQGGTGLAACGLAALGLRRESAQAAPSVAGAAQADADPGAEVTSERVAAALSEVERLARQVVEDNGVPGLAITVVHRDEVVYLGGFGVRDAGAAEPVDPDTVFQLASMSKPMAATTVAAVVGDRAASWDDRLIDHLPEFRLSDPWVTREVTIRDAFCHRTGLPGDAGDDLEIIGYDRDEIVHRLRYLDPASSFRSHYAYSNFGLTVGGLAAAAAAGQSWEDLAEERLYRPLGMTSTSSRYADHEAASNRALLHVRDDDGAWAPLFTRDADAQSPAGGVSSTVRDLAQWLRLELGDGRVDGEPVVAAAALAQAHTPHIVRGANLVTGVPSFYGLGWGVDFGSGGRVTLSHAGAFSFGARTQATLLPSEHLGIVVLSNAFPTGVPDGIAASFMELAQTGSLSLDWLALWEEPYLALMEAFGATAAEYATPPTPASPALPLTSYVGSYGNDYLGDVEVVEADGGLSLELGPRHQVFPLEHWDRDTFTYVPSPEPPAPPFGVTFAIGPDQTARQVVIENFEGDRGMLARVPTRS